MQAYPESPIIQGQAENRNASIDYLGGNGGQHPMISANSTGVTGLNLSASAGAFNSGAGTLAMTLSGTPTSAGTAYFSLDVGGQNCVVEVEVTPLAGTIDTLVCGSFDVTNYPDYPIIAGVSQSRSAYLDYTGGNGGPYSADTINSTGVTGLNLILPSGSLASGNGTFTFSLTGTPASTGTASFDFNFDGENCTLNVSVVPNPFCGGSGTLGDPWEICDPESLDAIAGSHGVAFLHDHFIQTADIDMTGEPFAIIGDYSTGNHRFGGAYDGQHYIIDNLELNYPGDSWVGMFGYITDEGTVDNVILRGLSLTAADRSGGLAAFNEGVINQSAVIESDIVVSDFAGGLVGINDGAIYRSYTYVDIAGDTQLGGFVSTNESNGVIREAYAVGEVLGSEPGGLVASNNGGQIMYTYAAGFVNTHGGGLIWQNAGTVDDSFWDAQTSQTGGSDGGDPLGTSDFSVQGNFPWNFGSVWEIALAPDGLTRPVFQWQDAPPACLPAAIPFGGGSGVAGDPYLICAPDHLNNVHDYPGDEFEVRADIDMAGESINMIGDVSTPFTGKFNGGGYTISNIEIIQPAMSVVGLFRFTNGETIFDLTLANINIEGGEGVGGLIGVQAGGSTITNVAISGTIIAHGAAVGGLIGEAHDFNGSELYTDVAIEVFGGSGRIGGIIGVCRSCHIYQASATGDIIAADGASIGGLVGETTGGGHLNQVYATGNIEGQIRVGGLIGRNDGIVENAYATGTIFAHDSHVGGLIGYNWGGDVINTWSSGMIGGGGQDGGLIGLDDASTTDSYWDVQTSGMLTSDAGDPLNTVDFNSTGNFPAWDFGSIWEIRTAPDLIDRPVFHWQPEYVAPICNPALSPFGGGDGSSGNPWRICTPDHLNQVGNGTAYLGDYFRLEDGIDASGINFNMIGSGANPFTGEFDGNDKTIDNLSIHKYPDDFIGMFPVINAGAVVENLHLTNLSVEGDNTVGGIAALNGGTIRNCTIYGSVKGQNGDIGGVVGRSGGRIDFTYAQVSVSNFDSSAPSGEINIGGLVGNIGSVSASISDSASGGAVWFTEADGRLLYAPGFEVIAGGLVGVIYAGDIRRSYSTAAVRSEIAGGFTGKISGINSLVNAYGAGHLSAAPSPVPGGFVRQNISGYPLSGSYWDLDTTNISTSDGGAGLNNAQFPDDGQFAGWDFGSRWTIGTAPDGFERPILQSTPIPHTPARVDTLDCGGAVQLDTIEQNSPANGARVHIYYSGGNGGLHPPNIWQSNSNELTAVIGQNNIVSGAAGIQIEIHGTPTTSGTHNFNLSFAGQLCVLGVEVDPTGPAFCGGDGSSGNPWQICDGDSLANVDSNGGAYMGDYFLVMNDINLGGATIDPIGSDSMPFTGEFNGNEYQILDFVINRPGDNYVGFFASMDGGECHNLTLQGGAIVGADFVGGLAGFMAGTAYAENCHFSGQVQGGKFVGGLVGELTESAILAACSADGGFVEGDTAIGGLVGLSTSVDAIQDSFSTMGNINCNGSEAGGLVGKLSNTTIENSYSTSNVAVRAMSGGGLVGVNGGRIRRSYASGDVTSAHGASFLGGLVGYNASGENYDVYATGRIHSVGGDHEGGLIGIMDGGILQHGWASGLIGQNGSPYGGLVAKNAGGSWVESYWDEITTGTSTSDAGVGYNTGHFSSQPNFYAPPSRNWDFGSIWVIGTAPDGYTRPIFQWQGGGGSGCDPGGAPFGGGAGTSGDPYQLCAPDHLINLSADSSVWHRQFILEDDIDMSSAGSFPTIAPDSGGTLFSGVINGNNHVIYNIYMECPGAAPSIAAGLVGWLDMSGIIENLSISPATFDASAGCDNVGIIAGMSTGTIENVLAIGEIVSANHQVGGIVGHNKGLIRRANSAVNIDAGDNIGGIVGFNEGDIEYSSSVINTVIGRRFVGGAIGLNVGNIFYSYATSHVEATADMAGGFIGQHDGRAEQCWSSGPVASPATAGGFAALGGGPADHCYWDIDTSTPANRAPAGETGLQTPDFANTAAFPMFIFVPDPGYAWEMAPAPDGPVRPMLAP